jgi:hypothetical protein
MRLHLSLTLSCALLTVFSACSSAPSSTANTSTSTASSGGPEYRPTATIKDLMDAEVDYNADWLWDAVSTEESAQGVVDRRPKTDDDWKEARNHAIALLEASNLLQMPGRAVAKPGEKSENPGIEEGPEEIKALMDADRASWVNYAHGLYDSTKLLLDAIDKKDADQMLDLGDQLDQACEKCHMHYWYPHQFDPHPNGLPPGEGASPNHEFSDRSLRKKDADGREQTPRPADRKK